MSPRAAVRSTDMPLPRRRNWCAVWVPAGIVTLARLPSIAGTSMVPPSAASASHRHAAMDVGAVALEDRVRLDRQENIEIAGAAAAHAGLALAGEPDARAVLDPRRDRHGSVFSLRTRPWPPQARQGLSMTRPAPWQDGQVRSMVKKPCCARTLPVPWQVGQLTGREPASAPLPLQASHGAGSARALGLLAGEGLLERRSRGCSADRCRAWRCRARRAAPPMNSPNISSKMSAKPAPKPKSPGAGAPPPFSKAAWPKRS